MKGDKVKVLFILQSIGYGGSMTSLINLVRLLKDRPEIDAEMLFMDPYGELLCQATTAGHVCATSKILQAVTLSRAKIRRMNRVDLLLLRLLIAILAKIEHTSTNQMGYRLAGKKYSGKYDCVVAYQESIATTFACSIEAPKRIAWVHNDYEHVERIYGSREKLYKIYSAYDKTVCVSNAGQASFQRESGIAENRIYRIYNTMNPKELYRKAQIKIEEVIYDEGLLAKFLEKNGCKFVSSGRFTAQKRFDRVIEAASRLKKDGVRFYWFILGDGVLMAEMRERVRHADVEDCVFLTGSLGNPFPVMAACDALVITSDFEAHPMVANEALILGKPVISTHFESAGEVVRHQVNGLICGVSSQGVYEAVSEFVHSAELRERLSQNARRTQYDDKQIVDQVIRLIAD